MQVGLVVLMGLACKNAILIVEFARELEIQGKGIIEAALEACRLRLRPIVMTSVAFIAGTVPLVLSHGAGAEVRSVTGITVFAGMLGVTLFGLFLTPVFWIPELLGKEIEGYLPLIHANPAYHLVSACRGALMGDVTIPVAGGVELHPVSVAAIPGHLAVFSLWTAGAYLLGRRR